MRSGRIQGTHQGGIHRRFGNHGNLNKQYIAGGKHYAKKNTTTNNSPNQTASKKPKVPSIDVRIDSLVDYEGSKMKAFASVNIGGAFAIHGLRVMEAEKGLFVSMPSRKDGEDYREVFHPVSSEAREELNKKVLEAYEQKLTEEQRWEQDETETLSEDESQLSVM